METETIDRLFLELSQVTQASTAKELAMQAELTVLRAAMRPFVVLVETSSGRIPSENLSLANWHDLVKVYRA